MTRRLTLALTAALVAVTLPLQGQGAAGAQTASKGTWTKLFNGRDLDGWEVVTTGQWTVEDGAIVMRRLPNNAGGGWLVTKKDFGDFILRLKFKPGKDQFNSGILVRDPGHAKTTRPALNGFEIKLAQGDRVENANGTIWYAASAYFHRLPVQEWTLIEVRCVGDHITTFLDGRKMAETHTRRSYKGAVGLHLHGGTDSPECRWKDIEILELPTAARDYQLMEERLAQAPGSITALLEQIAAGGGPARSSSGESAWTLKNGILRGNGERGDAWLKTPQTYADFILDFDFRVSSQGDAGLAFRVPKQAGNDSKGSGGYEFHIVDGDAVNPTASIVDFARAFMLDYSLQRIYRPGQWNHASIYAENDHLVTYLNLEKEADVHAAHSREGNVVFRVGAGATAEFRNVNIRPVSPGLVHTAMR